ncbi:NTP transferase domain-containing protein [Candidatus Kaiserbacteria bacterium]|nr:NTP transferase domain-containing protein [Candidatus Kaiserbacteria bacterium]
MQAVILAAGRGTRMKELTDSTPKALLEVAGKPLIQHELDALPAVIDEVIIIVGYLGSKIQERFGGEYKGKRILYVEQDTLDGTAGALSRAKSILKDRFLVIMSDDLYARDDIERCIAVDGWAVLVQHRNKIKSKGKVETKDGKIVRITEGHHGDIPGLLNTNCFVFDTRIFDVPMVPKAAGSNEFGLPQTAIAAAETLRIPFYAIETDRWFEITDPEDLEEAPEYLTK